MYTEHILSNGVKVIMTELDVYRSVSIGFWIKTGSINETKTNNGISHFIEHMLFKGTKTRTAKDIAEIFDSVGGDLNAFTSKECTCFHARVMDIHLEIAIKVISDMITNPALRAIDIKKEKGVVIDEINMAEDTPDDVSYDLIYKVLFGEDSLSRPILGNSETVKSFNVDIIKEHMNKYYTTDNIVISIAGSLDKENVIELLEQNIGKFKTNKKIEINNNNICMFGKGFIYKDIEQVHLEIAYKGLSYANDEIFSLAALNNILGASVSSRLFQSIREDNGLTYSINSYITQHKTVGLFSIYACMNNDNLLVVTKLIKIELDKLRNKTITDFEILKVKDQLKGNYILDLEGSESYMSLLGKGKLFGKKIRTQEEIELKIDEITLDSIEKLISKILKTNNFSIAIVGKISEDNLNECNEILKI